MSTHVPQRAARAPRNRPWSTATIPSELLDRLVDLDDAREQLAAVAMHHFEDLTRQIAWQVGDETAQDLVQDVVMRHLARHDRDPQPDYAAVPTYHRLRASLIASARFAAIDHLRRHSGRGEVPLPDALAQADRQVIDQSETSGVLDADAAALHDGLRRIDRRRASVLRMRLTGATFEEIADNLGVSLSSAYKVYQKALRDVHPVLTRYIHGDYCSEYAPFLLLACDSRGADPHEHPLAAVVGDARARQITLHVFGDPDVEVDDGCPLCQRAATQFGAVLVDYLPMPLLLLPASGIVAGLKAAITSIWGAMTGTAAAKGVAVAAASAIAIGGTISVTQHRLSAPAPSTIAPAVRVSSAPAGSRGLADAQRPTMRRTPPKKTPTPRSASSEFEPAPSTSTKPSTTQKHRPGNAAAEFSP
jgi:RNA polymerase sigma factor (sigma-70 family)